MKNRTIERIVFGTMAVVVMFLFLLQPIMPSSFSAWLNGCVDCGG